MASDRVEVAVVAAQSLVAQTNERLEATLADRRLTQATAQALWSIDPDESPPSMKTMAQRLFCNAPNLTFVINQLEQRGFVERRVDPDDRRSRQVLLTEEGARVRADIVSAAVAGSPLARLNDAQLQRFIALAATAMSAVADA